MKLELDINSLQNTLVSADANTSDNGSSEEVKKALRNGIKLAKEGSRTEARQMLLSVTKAEPANETAWLWLASISEYPEELLIFLQNVLKINPDNERANEWAKQTKSLLSKTFVQRGISASQDNQKEFAKQCFLQGIVHDDENEMAWLWLASSSDSQEEKVSHLQRVLAINPNNETALNSLNSVKQQVSHSVLKKANSAAISGDHETARQMLESIMKNTPNLEEAWILKAFLANDFYEKISCYEKTLEFNPHNEAAQAGLASLKSLAPKGRSHNHSSIHQTSEPNIHQTIQPTAEEVVIAEVPAKHLAAVEELAVEESVIEESVVNEEIVSYQSEETAAPVQEFNQDLTQAPQVSESEIEAEHLAMQESFEEAEAETGELETEVFNEAEAQASEEVTNSNNDYFAEQSFSNVIEAESNEDQITFAEQVDSPTQELDEEVLERANEVFLGAPEASMESEVVEKVEQTVEQETYFSETADETKNSEEHHSLLKGYSESVENHEPATVTEEEHFTPYQPETVVEEHFVAYQQSEVESSPVVTAEQTFEQTNFVENQPEAETVLEDQPAYSEYSVASSESFVTDDEQISVQQVVEQSQETELIQEYHHVTYCPFCEAENEAIICNNCHAMTSLADIEMLLAHQSSNQEMILQGIQRLESEKNSRHLSSEELQNLGVAHLNVKNLRQGLAYLQSASQLNPNDVFLSSKVNALAGRLAEIEQHEHKVSIGKPSQSRTILVVDDSPTVRKLISGKLEKCGHSVLSAVDGMDALAKINEVIPDLILLDITMPRLDGYQVCKLIRNNEVTKDVPIVMISGKDGFFDKVRGRMAGSSGYITKPFGPDTLMKTIETFLN